MTLTARVFFFFDVLLTVLLRIFMLVINQLDAQNFVLQYVYFMPLHVSSTTCSSSGGQKLYYTASGIIIPIGSRPVHRTATYRDDDTRGCIIQFWPPDDENTVLETCRGMK